MHEYSRGRTDERQELYPDISLSSSPNSSSTQVVVVIIWRISSTSRGRLCFLGKTFTFLFDRIDRSVGRSLERERSNRDR